jgi:hypothetical protein
LLIIASVTERAHEGQLVPRARTRRSSRYAASDGAAQTSDQTTRGLKLSPSQREAIYQSVPQKNNAAPIGFRPSVGSVVPKGIDLAPLPDTLGEMIPEARGYEVTMVEKQILLVDPGSKVVIALMTGE